MSASLYSPLSLSRPDVRFLELRKGHIYEKIVCDLIVTGIGDVYFEALSYVWGPERKPLSIIDINGHDVAVTNNLEYALQDLRYPGRNRMLWVDAICINQEDLQERNHQVRLMRQIYERAGRVVVWLNSSYDHMTANDDINLLLSALKSEEVHWFPRNRAKNTTDRPLRRAMEKLTRSPWWRRIWTVQEAAVAKELVFMHGRSEIPGYWLGQLLANIYRHFALGCCSVDIYDNITLSLCIPELDLSFQSGASEQIKITSCPKEPQPGFGVTRLIEDPFVSNPRHSPLSIAFLVDISNLEVLRKRRRTSFLQLAATCRYRLATDPRDKVFALLGLAEGLEEFVIDYELPVSEVYEQLAMELIRQTRSLEIFNHVLPRAPVLAKTEEGEAQIKMPSWLPDWSNQEDSFERLEVLRYRNYFMQLFNAGGGRSPIVDRISPGRLEIQGFALDTVHKLGAWISSFLWLKPPAGLVIEQIAKWRQLAGLKHPRKSYIGGSTRQEAFWRSLCFDSRFDVESSLLLRAGEYDRVVYENWWRWVTDPEHRTNRTPCDCGWPLCGFDPGPTISGSMRDFQDHVLKCVNDRRFAVSRKGYFGLLPCDTKVGDRILIFPGGKVPFILREVEGSGDGKEEPVPQFKLVGDAYVHGVMDGQVWDLVEKGEVKSQNLILC